MKEILQEAYQFVLTAFVLGLLLGYLIQPSQEPKELVCKNEIAELKLLKMQLEGLRVDYAEKKQQIIIDCQQKARDEALKKIEAYKAVCEELKCEICKKAGKL
jgi:predicted phage tail protein